MPKELQRRLRATASQRGYGTERTDRYVYGTIAQLKKKGRIK